MIHAELVVDGLVMCIIAATWILQGWISSAAVQISLKNSTY